MTRRRLWSLTALACALLAVPSLPDVSLDRLGASTVTPHWVLAAGLLLILSLVIVAVRRHRTTSGLVMVMARRGRPVAAIARRTGLAQDAVRDLLGGEPTAVSTASWGRIFRRRKAGSPAAGASFADELSERSFDAKA
jgi:hypothetical protein